MNQFEEIRQRQRLVADQILKGIVGGEELIEKAHNVGDIHPNGKWVWTQLPSGKYDWRVRKTDAQPQQKKDDAGDKMSIPGVSRIVDGFKVQRSEYSDLSKMSLEKTPKGNWRLYYDGKDTGTTMSADVISDANAKKAGLLKEEEKSVDEQIKKLAKDNGYNYNIYGAVVGSNDRSHAVWVGLKEVRGEIKLDFIDRKNNMVDENPFVNSPEEVKKIRNQAERKAFDSVDSAHKAALEYIKEIDRIYEEKSPKGGKFSIKDLQKTIKDVKTMKQISVNCASSYSMENAMKIMFSHFGLKNSVNVDWESKGFAGSYEFFVDSKNVQGYRVFSVDRKMGYADFADCVNDCIAYAIIKNNKLKGKEADEVNDIFGTYSHDAPQWNLKSL